MSSAVYTVGEECKKCYSCVRICPTKAINVHSGQAEIIEELCISCGYCVTMCSQNAKRVRSSVDAVRGLLHGGNALPPGAGSTGAACPSDLQESGPDATGSASLRTVAMLAPSFPGAFLDLDPQRLVGALRQVGFDAVYEVAFGADLVSYAYYRQFHQLKDEGEEPGRFLISTPCPAVVSYVERLHPELVPHLAGILSPMEAMARVIRQRIDPESRIVFIGPCVAKKTEAQRADLVDEVMTFAELAELFEVENVDTGSSEPSDFDPPHANLGRIYPVTGGLLKAAAIDADLLGSPVYVVEGQERVVEILSVLSDRIKGERPVVNKLFDLLFCEGCIAGPAIPNNLTFYERRKYIIEYMKRKELITDIEEWAKLHRDYLSVDLSKTFSATATTDLLPTEEEILAILAKTNKFRKEDELNCRACGYNSCRDKAAAVYQGKAEVEMCLPYLISRLEQAISDQRNNQAKLIQAEKLASMGQMAAGIAHEINNPLGIVLMYAHLLKEELESSNTASQDVDVIIRESERTRKIVQGILNFARKEKIERAVVDINTLVAEAAESIRDACAGNLHVELELDGSLEPQQVDASQLRQVFDNVLKNAAEFMPDGGTITVATQAGAGDFRVRIADTGPGIPEEHLPQIFSPFFTTKPVGKGTGLGLPVCYGIVKMHGGTIQAGNNPDGGAYFEIVIKQTATREESCAAKSVI